MFLKILQNSQENTCASVYFLIKLQVKACSFIKKEALQQVFFYEFCGIFKDISFNRTPVAAASPGYFLMKKFINNFLQSFCVCDSDNLCLMFKFIFLNVHICRTE